MHLARQLGKRLYTSAARSVPPQPLAFDVVPKVIHPAVREAALEYPTFSHLPVQWGDMYIRDFSAYLPAHLAHTFQQPEASHPGPIVAAVTTRYRNQVHYPDTLTYFIRLQKEMLETALNDPTADRATIETLAISNKTGKVVADGTCVVVTFDYAANRKCPLPDYLRVALKRWEVDGRERNKTLFAADK
ncbi:hypothetical protein RI367_002857 [Sorochytrium milnesiophthora]